MNTTKMVFRYLILKGLYIAMNSCKEGMNFFFGMMFESICKEQIGKKFIFRKIILLISLIGLISCSKEQE